MFRRTDSTSRSADSRAEASATVDPPGTAPADSPVLKNSMAGSVWTVATRSLGLCRTITIGAVLGATYLGNTFQAVNSLPNIVYYQLLAGSLFAALLVPALVQHIENGDPARSQALVEGFFGTFLLAAAALSAILVAAGPLVLRLITIGVPNHQVAQAQIHVGLLFLVMFVPQISLYLIAGTGAAVMNAHGRFALAAAAPALESLGIIAVLGISMVVFGPQANILDVSNAQIALLGLGTTAAVAVHATCQWLGARSTGTRIRPRWAWRDPEIRKMVRKALPTLAFTGLEALTLFAIIVGANRVRGGVVAFQLALNFFYLPTAIVTWPMARALLPQLVKRQSAGDAEGFQRDFVHTIAMATFVTVPIATAYMALSWPIARSIAFGQLRSAVYLLAPSIAALSLAVVGETWFILATYACYARGDVRIPLQSMFVRVGITVTLMMVAMLARGPIVLVLLGLSLSFGSLAGAFRIGWKLRRVLPQFGSSLMKPVVRIASLSVVAIVPIAPLLVFLDHITKSRLLQTGELAAALVCFFGLYLALQTWIGAPEIESLRATPLIRRGRRLGVQG